MTFDAVRDAIRVRQAYGRRAAEYAAVYPSIAAVHAGDLALVRDWAARCSGPLLDAGCGPGHFAADLHELGHDVRGIDLTPEFIELARRAYPRVRFDIGSMHELDVPDGSLGGILSWYSTIHLRPEAIDAVLAGLGRALRPGGLLLVGFFVSERLVQLDHQITPAWSWPLDELTTRLEHAGFTVEEWHTRRVAALRPRPHAALLAASRMPGLAGG